MRSFACWALGLSSLALLGCAELPEVRAGICGDQIVDPNEDCDTFAPGGARCAAPGSAHACRFVCDGAGCPKGYGCGLDGVCRARGTGAFELTSDQLPGLSLSLQSGDFDGDGRADLLAVTTAGLEVAFFDANGALGKSATFSAPASLPAVGSLEDPAAAARSPDSVAISGATGVDLFRGSRGRTFTPAAATNETKLVGAKDVRLLIVDEDPSLPGDELMGLLTFNKPQLRLISDKPTTPIAFFAKPATELSGPPIVARLDPAAGCDDILLGYLGEALVHVIRPCAPNGKGGFVESTPDKSEIATLGLPAPLVGPIHLYDVDGDGYADLFANIACASNAPCQAGVALAFGNVGSTFGSAPMQKAPDETAFRYADLADPCGGAPNQPLQAVADWNEDGIPDFLTLTSLTLSEPAGGVVDFLCGTGQAAKPSAPVLGGTVQYVATQTFQSLEGVKGRFGVAAHEDAAVALLEGGILFLEGTGTSRLNGSVIPTTGRAKDLSVGDYDGDLVADLLFAEANVPGAEGETLSALFGRASGTPEGPFRFGSLGDITQIERADLRAFGNDAIDDGIVISKRTADDSLDFALFAGSSTRLLSTPIVFDGEVAAADIADYDGDGHGDLAVISRRGASSSLAVLKGQGAAQLAEQPLLRSPIVQGVSLESYADGELLVAPGIVGRGFTLGHFKARANDAKSTLFFAHPEASEGGFRGVIELVVMPPPTTGAPTTRVPESALPKGVEYTFARVADVDGDGREDLVFRLAHGGAPAGLAILWNQDGALSLDVLSTTAFPELAKLTDFALVEADGRPGLELVMSAPDGVYLATQTAPRAFGSFSARADLSRPGAPVPAITAADFDGDGVQDLAVAGAGFISFYRGAPTLP